MLLFCCIKADLEFSQTFEMATRFMPRGAPLGFKQDTNQQTMKDKDQKFSQVTINYMMFLNVNTWVWTYKHRDVARDGSANGK